MTITNKAARICSVGAKSLLAFITVVSLSEWAVAQDEIHHFDIEEQKLTTALLQFSEQSDTLLVMHTELIADRSAPGVKGNMPATEALEKLLEGSGLEYSVGDDGGVTVVHAEQTEDLSSGKVLPTSRPMLMAQASMEQNRRAATDTVEAVNEDTEKADFQIEEIVVTGTNIRGVQNPTTPVLQFDRMDIELSGAATVEDFIRTIPQNFNSSTQLAFDSANPNTTSNGTQGATIDLRGLGPGSTLTLLNGRRMSSAGLSNFVDISILPLGAIERVDVLTDGASAIYGSDAVGGVVNFITRKDYQGFDLNARYGTVTDGAKEDFGIGAAGGTNWGSGGGFIGVDYLEQTPLNTSDRSFVDQAAVQEGSTFGSETERLSVATSLNQEIFQRLQTGVDVLFSDRRADNADINAGSAIVDRADQEAFFVNTRAEYDISNQLVGALLFDYGRNELETSDSRTDFEVRNELINEQTTIEGQLSGQIFDLPGGSVSIAAGALHRTEEFESTSIDLSADRDVTAVYAEALIPIIGESNEVQFVQRLELSVAGRYEDYSDFGDTLDPKLGLFWEIFDGLSFRGSYSESFRVPDLESVNRPLEYFIIGLGRSTFTAVEPPEADDRLSFPDQVVVLFPFVGNPDLEPETAETWSAGFVYQPEFVKGLTIEGNYFDIDYTNRLESIFTFEPIQVPEFALLVDSPPNPAEIEAIFAGAASGAIAIRDFAFLSSGPTQPEDIQVLINAGIRNVTRREVSGVDLNARYESDTEIGRLTFGLSGSYLTDFTGQVSDLAAPVDQRNTLYRPIDLSLRANASWSSNGLTAFAALNYRDSYQDNVANDIDAWTTVDISLLYDVAGRRHDVLANIRVGLSVTNLFDEEPPFVSTAEGLNFDTANADPFGRQINFTIENRFW